MEAASCEPVRLSRGRRRVPPGPGRGRGEPIPPACDARHPVLLKQDMELGAEAAIRRFGDLRVSVESHRRLVEADRRRRDRGRAGPPPQSAPQSASSCSASTQWGRSSPRPYPPEHPPHRRRQLSAARLADGPRAPCGTRLRARLRASCGGFRRSSSHRRRPVATVLAIRDLERAGIDVVTDGEIRRESYRADFANPSRASISTTPARSSSGAAW